MSSTIATPPTAMASAARPRPATPFPAQPRAALPRALRPRTARAAAPGLGHVMRHLRRLGSALLLFRTRRAVQLTDLSAQALTDLHVPDWAHRHVEHQRALAHYDLIKSTQAFHPLL